MSVATLGSKRAVYDIWPIRNKRFFVLVDPQNILGETMDGDATLGTVKYILEKKGAVVVAASFGLFSGIPLTLQGIRRKNSDNASGGDGESESSTFIHNTTSHVKRKGSDSTVNLDLSLNSVVDNKINKGCTSFWDITREKGAASISSQLQEKNAVFSTFAFVEVFKEVFPDTNVMFAPDCLSAPVDQLNSGEILVLENLRCYSSETSQDQAKRMEMAKLLAKHIDFFVNESFATASLELASNTALPKILHHGAAGISMDRELAFFSRLLTHPARPIAVVVAGKYAPEKLLMVRSLIGKVEKILIAGALELPFLAAKGLTFGKGFNPSGMVKRKPLYSGRRKVVEESIPCSQLAQEIISLCEKMGVELVLPVDHIVTKRLKKTSEACAVIVESVAVPSDVYAVDCGANTVALFAKCIRDCQCVYWTGTLGWTKIGFSEGTRTFATLLAEERKLSIIGGRSAAQTIQQFGLTSCFSHVSGADVSCLELLQGNLLSGVDALSDVAPPLNSSCALSIDELLRNLSLFSGCTSHQIKAAARKFVRRIHVCGDYLTYRGDRHVSMWVVAHGGLVARFGENALTTHSRYIGCGQTVGMYEFITQAFATETVQAAVNETVTYQLTSSSLGDLLYEHPGLATRFLQNVSEPLYLLAQDEYKNYGSMFHVLNRAASCFRVLGPYSLQQGSGLIEDILQGIASTLLLQRLKMRYVPYPPFLETRKYDYLLKKIAVHGGLAFALSASIVRSVVYYSTISLGFQYATFIAAIVTVPLRLLAMGTQWRCLTYKKLLDEAFVSVTANMTSFAAYAGYLVALSRLERFQRKKCPRVVRVIILMVVNLLCGIVIFPILYSRRAETSSLTLFDIYKSDAFKAYELSQVLSVLLRCVVHLLLRLARKTHAFCVLVK